MTESWNGYCLNCGYVGHRASGCLRAVHVGRERQYRQAICWKATESVPVGYVALMAEPHPNFLWKNGALLSKVQFAGLYAVVGDRFALPGDTDPKMFRLPDSRT